MLFHQTVLKLTPKSLPSPCVHISIIIYLYMQYIQGNNRNQAVLFPGCLDELVDQNKKVRNISSHI